MGHNAQIVTELVERTAHDSVCAVEGLFDAIAVMYIDINVQNSRVESAVQAQYEPPIKDSSLLQQLQDTKNNIIDVAKA